MPTLAAQGVLLLLAAACFMANASSSDDSKSIVMVESEPCTDFKSTWAEVSSALNGQVKLGQLDITDNMDHVQTLGVLDDGLPALRMYTKRGDRVGMSIPTTANAKAIVKQVKRALQSTGGQKKSSEL